MFGNGSQKVRFLPHHHQKSSSKNGKSTPQTWFYRLKFQSSLVFIGRDRWGSEAESGQNWDVRRNRWRKDHTLKTCPDLAEECDWDGGE